MFGAHEATKAFIREMHRLGVEPDDILLPEPYFTGWPMVGAFRLPEYRLLERKK